MAAEGEVPAAEPPAPQVVEYDPVTGDERIDVSFCVDEGQGSRARRWPRSLCLVPALRADARDARHRPHAIAAATLFTLALPPPPLPPLPPPAATALLPRYGTLRRSGVPAEFNENLPKDSEEYKRWKASREAEVSGAMEGLSVAGGGGAAGGEGGAAAAAAAPAAAEKQKSSKKSKKGQPEVRGEGEESQAGR